MKYIWVLLLCAACAHDITGLNEMVPYDNPAVLSPLWDNLEACSGLRGDFTTLHFFTAPSLVTDGRDTNGLWLGGFNWIVVIDRLKNEPRVWKHEMMHALLGGGSDHPAKYFNGVCGNLMAG